MTTVTIGAGSLPGAMAQAFRDLFEKDRQAAVRALRAAAVEVHAEAVRQVDASTPYPPVDTGALKRSFRFRPTQDGAVVENTSPQAVWMEYGTKPHWAPLLPLVAWAMRKARGGTLENVYALAKGTRKAIAARGTAPRHFWQRTLAKAPGIVERHVRAALGAVTP